MTPRPPARSAGRYSRKSTEESHLSSSRSSLEPPAPSGAVRSASCDFSPSVKGTQREKPWVRTRIVIPRPGVPGQGHCRPELPRPGVPERGYCRPTSPTRLPTGWHRRLLTLLEYSTDNVVLFWQPPSYFSQWSPSSFVVDGVSCSCAEQFMMAEKARLLKDHRAVELIMSSPDPITQTHRSRRCLLYTSPSPRDKRQSRMPSSA